MAEAVAVGAAYEHFIGNNMLEAYKTACPDTQFTIAPKIVQDMAGSGDASDVYTLVELTALNGASNLKERLRLNIEVKHIKSARPSTSGLDFGQFTLKYICELDPSNANVMSGTWVINEGGTNYKKAQKAGKTGLMDSMVVMLNGLDAGCYNKNDFTPTIGDTLDPHIWKVDNVDPKKPNQRVVRGINEAMYYKDHTLDAKGKFMKENRIKKPALPMAWPGGEFIIAGNAGKKGVDISTDPAAQQLLLQAKEFYSNKGDDLIQIKHFGVFTLKDKSQYGKYPACPTDWYDNPKFKFSNALDKAKKISIRLRLKPHDRKPGNFRDFACAVRFDLDHKNNKSPYDLDKPDTTLAPLTHYWCTTFKEIQTEVFAVAGNDNEEDNEEENVEDKKPHVIDGCSIMGGRKKRTRKRKSRKTRRVKKRKHNKTKHRKRNSIKKRKSHRNQRKKR